MRFSLIFTSLLSTIVTIASPLPEGESTAAVSSGMAFKLAHFLKLTSHPSGVQRPCFLFQVWVDRIMISRLELDWPIADASSAYGLIGCARPNGNTLVSTVSILLSSSLLCYQSCIVRFPAFWRIPKASSLVMIQEKKLLLCSGEGKGAVSSFDCPRFLTSNVQLLCHRLPDWRKYLIGAVYVVWS